MKQKKVAIYVDGFNLYHAIDDLNEDHLKWLNLWALGEKLLPDNGSEVLVTVKYFSAYATWREHSMRRHQRYVAALKASGVTVVLGRFKEKRNRCRTSNAHYISHEEKETDVNIGAHLMADALQGRFDRALIISADTDLNGVVELARKEATDKIINLVAPPKRRGRNRAALFEIPKGKIKTSLLPAVIDIGDGKVIERPAVYKPPTLD
jgi:uncharacterized LabA/DUF88 family protein